MSIYRDPLTHAIFLANCWHRYQYDKQGELYILHPIRVMLACAPNKEAMIVGVLHDTIEDSPEYNVEKCIHETFSPTITEAVVTLTRAGSEPYMDYIKRVKQNPLATLVKIADLKDNIDPARNPNPEDKDTARRLAKYQKALAFLQQ